MAGQTHTQPKWIIPPELKQHFDEFLELYNIVFKNSGKKQTLLIHGDTGVGKSLFTYIFETLYRKDNPKIKNEEIKRVNVSALAQDVIESELFGHEKGAFTGAVVEKAGFFKNTKLLILEEIGELEEYLQAKLLTVLEDGIFYPVGQTQKPIKVDNLQVIATTNVALDKRFRRDFLGRCYVFTVPPFHERRGDVLYTLANLYPPFFRTLSPYQVMAILAYNWPENIREIMKFGKVKHTKYCLVDFMDKSLVDGIRNLFNEMGVLDWKRVNHLLYEGHLSMHLLSEEAHKPIFDKIKLNPPQSLDEFPDIKILSLSKEIEEAKKYFWLYTRLICMDIKDNIHLIDRDAIMEYRKPFVWRGVFGDYKLYNLFEREKADKLLRILKKINEYVSQHRLKERDRGVENPPDLFSKSFDELTKIYLAEQLRRSSNNKSEAARRSDMNLSTFKYQLKKYNLNK